MTLAADLKAAVLQAALKGELTERICTDTPICETLKQIQEEKRCLLSTGKIKEEKPLPEIDDSEIPFPIPDEWCWKRWGDISFSIQYGYNAPALTAGRIKMVRISDIQGSSVKWDTVPYCDISEREIETYCLAVNDILFARTGGTVGKSYIVTKVPEEAIYAGYLIRTRYSEKLVPQYLKYFMESELYWNQLRNGTKISAQPNCNGKTLSRMIIPIPPIEEQQRIVDRINELMPTINEYEKMEKCLLALKEAFPGNLRESILFSAIQGKLTQQYDSDEPIANLKKRLTDRKTAAGVISKNDKLPMSHPTFDIPESWTWTTLSKLGTLSGGKTPSMQDTGNWASPDVNWFTSKDMKQKYLSESMMKISLKASEELHLFPSGTLLMVVRSGILKHTLPLCILTQEATINQDLKAFTLFDNEMSEYVYWMLKGLQPEIITRYTKHVTTVDSLKMDELFYQMPVPLPPIEEQRRIVERLNTILPLCDALAEDI